MKRAFRWMPALLLLVLAGQAAARGVEKRPESWARPVLRPGLPNLHRVSESLYRGAQPTAEGMKHLEALGVKTVVNLRSMHSDQELLKGTRLRYETLPMTAWNPKEEDVLKFLRIVTDPSAQPVFVHCQHGADRTGAMVAIYRIVVQGWDREEAIREMTDGGFGFHAVWGNLPRFLRGLDMERLRTQVNVPKTEP